MSPNPRPWQSLREAVLVGLPAVLMLAVALGVQTSPARAQATLSPVIVSGNAPSAGVANCNALNNCTSGAWVVTVVPVGNPISAQVTAPGGTDVLVNASFTQQGDSQNRFIHARYKLTCTPGGGSSPCIDPESPVSEVHFGWNTNVPALGGLSYTFRLGGAPTTTQTAVFALEMSSGNGVPYRAGKVNFFALPLRASNGSLLTQNSPSVDQNVDSFDGITWVNKTVGPYYSASLSGVQNQFGATGTIPLADPALPWSMGQRVWIMGADDQPLNNSQITVAMFNGEFPLASVTNGGRSFTYTMYEKAPRTETVGVDPRGGIQIREYPTDLQKLLYSPAYGTTTAPYGFLAKDGWAAPPSQLTTTTPLEVRVTTPSQATYLSDIVYSFNTTVAQHPFTAPDPNYRWRLGEFRIFYTSYYNPAGTTPFTEPAVGTAWTPVPNETYTYWKSADGAFLTLLPSPNTYLGDVGPLQIWGRLPNVSPGYTYVFRVIADYQAYQEDVDPLTRGIDAVGGSLMAFNTSYNGGVFKTVQASGRRYANGANSINYGDLCGAGCWGIGFPVRWRTEPFAPVVGSTMLGIGSIYGWATKDGGAAEMRNFGISVGKHPLPPANNFGTPETTWDLSVGGSYLTGDRNFQGSRPKNCMQNGVGWGCDISPGMTNGRTTIGAFNTITGPFWGGFTDSLTGQQSGINGDLIFIDLTSRNPTWAPPAEVRAEAAGGRTTVSWTTSGEFGSASFRLERADKESGEYVAIGPKSISAMPPWPYGATYAVEDPDALVGEVYNYRIVETESDGNERSYGPYWVEIKPADGRLESRSATGSAGFSRDLKPLPARAAVRAAAGSRQLPPGGSSWKALVAEEGIYAVPTGATGAARNHELTNLGRPVAYVNDGANQRLLFYGTSRRTLHSDKNAYLLAPGTPRFMKETDGKLPAPGVQPAYFLSTRHVEEDQFPAFSYVTEEGRDFWLWKYLQPDYPTWQSASMAFDLQALAADPAATASIRLSLYNSRDTAGVAELQFGARINGTPIPGTVVLDGPGEHSATLDFPAAWLREGGNSLTLDAILAPGARDTLWWVDSFDVTYPRRYQAYLDEAKVRAAAGQWVVRVGGFTRSDIMVLDVTNPLDPVLVKAASVQRAGTGYAIEFRATSPGGEYYLATGHRLRSASLEPLSDEGLATRTAGAQHLVIAPSALMTEARELAAYRTSTGLSSMAIPLEAIWDEFGFGLPSPDALSRFLRFAEARWSPAPAYVVLAGKGTFDERDLWGMNDHLIPTWFKGTALGLRGTDSPYVAGTAMSIGRIPATSGGELARVTAKLAAHDLAEPSFGVTLLAGRNDPSGNFPSGQQAIAGVIPEHYFVSTANLEDHPMSVVRQEALGAFERGDAVLAWVGHGGIDRLDSAGVLTEQDVASLPSTKRLPLLAGATCNINNFFMPGSAGLGGALVGRAEGGALATVAPVGASFDDISVPIVQKMMRELLTGRVRSQRLGDVIRAVEQSLEGGEAGEFPVWQLLGDPGSVVP